MASSSLLVRKSLLLMMILLCVASATAARRLHLDAIAGRKAIVNGQTVSAAEQPYLAFQVHLLQIHPNGTTGAHCGGSIIAPSYVLTAGHCLERFGYTTGGHWKMDPKSKNGSLNVLAGWPDFDKPEAGSQVSVASELWIHKDYARQPPHVLPSGIPQFRLSDDLAILKLDRAFNFSDSVRSIALSPDDSALRVDTDLSTAGWGGIMTGEVWAHKLQMVTVNHLPNVCAKYFKSGGPGGYQVVTVPEWGLNDSFYYDEKSMICAGCENGGTGTCPGDSGGPLYALSSSGGCPVLVGVTSWLATPKKVCGWSPLPDFYARVSCSLSWIESVVGQAMRSTVPLSPTANCENCLANDFPDGENCDKASRYDLKKCNIQARLAASFTLRKPVCRDGKRHTLKASIDFRKGFPNASEELKRTLTDGQVVFLYSAEGTGNGVISLPASSGRNDELINTPLRQPKVLAAKVAFDSKEGAWVYRSTGCSSARTYAALYMRNTDSEIPLYRQISLAVRA